MLLGGLLVDVFLICVEHQSCQEQKFTMLVIKKNLRVSERFPYPVRVEAVLEVIDQFPMRKLEKMTRKGSHLRFHYLTFIFMWWLILKVLYMMIMLPFQLYTVKCLSCLASIIHFLPLTQFRVIEVWSLSQRSWSDSQDIPWTCYQYIAGLAERVRQQFTLTCTSMVKSTSQIKLM